MSMTVILGVGVVIGIVIAVSVLSGKKEEVRTEVKEVVVDKEYNLKKIEDVLNKKGRVTNDEVQELLGVSDATATRYLDDLEKDGRIRQVGTTGRHVYYQRK